MNENAPDSPRVYYTLVSFPTIVLELELSFEGCGAYAWCVRSPTLLNRS